MKFSSIFLTFLVLAAVTSFTDFTVSSFARQPLPETNNKVRYTDLTGKQQIYVLYEQLMAGRSFGQLARQYSQDYGSYTIGGNLGWQKPDQFVPIFANTVGQLTKAQFSQPFKTEFGYHIVQLMASKHGEVLTRHILLRISS